MLHQKHSSGGFAIAAVHRSCHCLEAKRVVHDSVPSVSGTSALRGAMARSVASAVLADIFELQREETLQQDAHNSCTVLRPSLYR